MMTRIRQPGDFSEISCWLSICSCWVESLTDKRETASGNLMEELAQTCDAHVKSASCTQEFPPIACPTPPCLRKVLSTYFISQAKYFDLLFISQRLRVESVPCKSMRSLNTRRKESSKQGKVKGKGKSKTKDGKPGAGASRICHHCRRTRHYTCDCWHAGNADMSNDNKNDKACAQPTAVHIKHVKDAMGRLGLALGMSDSGTIVSSFFGRAVRSILKQSHAPSLESLWKCKTQRSETQR